MPMTAYPEVDTPYLFPAYDSTLLRAPLEPLIEAPRDMISQSPGPDFRRIPVPADGADLLHRHEGEPIGERIVLDGRVLDSGGQPVPGTLVEMWQTNAAGIYEDPSDPGFFPHDPNFSGAGRCLTGADGRFRFRTIKPGAYPQAPGQIYRPSHVHFSVFGPTLGSRLITQCYFEGDPLIGRDPIACAAADGLERLIARLDPDATQSDGSQSALTYRYDITLRGPCVVGNPSQTIGPRYGYALMFDGSERTVSPDEPDAIEIRGTVLDGHGQHVAYPDAMLEFWAPGQFARTRTDPDGGYRAVLRKPLATRLSTGSGGQAPHLDVAVFARGLLKQAQTRLYFPDKRRANAADPVLLLISPDRRPTLIARPGDGGLRFDIRLQGPGETVFFAF